MAWWNPFSRRLVGASEKPEEVVPLNRTASRSERTPFTVMAAGIDNIVKETNDFRDNYDYTNEFDLYDNMLNYDPELNGAVRTISLTANKYKISGGKNAAMRKAITNLTEEVLDFDDLLINAMRNLMVYGNDISKYVGKTGVGLTEVQSLPVSQMTILDNRPPNTTTDKDNAILTNERYLLREQDRDMQEFPRDEILHIRIDYRSYWYKDRLGRWTYGVWGASRFSSLKQAIRAKYNSMNNRIALEDSLTKQYITIGPEATANITDPDEANARLGYVMDEVGTLLDGLRADQVPILPIMSICNSLTLRIPSPITHHFLIASTVTYPQFSMCLVYQWDRREGQPLRLHSTQASGRYSLSADYKRSCHSRYSSCFLST